MVKHWICSNKNEPSKNSSNWSKLVVPSRWSLVSDYIGWIYLGPISRLQEKSDALSDYNNMLLNKCWIHSGLYYEIILNLRWAMVSSCGLILHHTIQFPTVLSLVDLQLSLCWAHFELKLRLLWTRVGEYVMLTFTFTLVWALTTMERTVLLVMLWRLSPNQTTAEFILACILSSIWIYIALNGNLNLIVLAYVELTLSLSWDCFELMFEIAWGYEH